MSAVGPWWPEGPEGVEAAVAALGALPGVAEAIEDAREACTRLRWHEGLRRRKAEAGAESRIRGARASATLEGAEVGLDRVREVMVGAVSWPDPDPVERVALGAMNATGEAERLSAQILSAPAGALARLHVAATGGWLDPGVVGRPRVGSEGSAEFTGLGTAAPVEQVSQTIAAMGALLRSTPRQPVLLVAALVHGELARVRPFVAGNGVVARAVERAVLVGGGLDPTGVAVPEVGHHAGAGVAYFGALTAYVSGTAEGAALWVRHCADAVAAGAAEGERIADAVRAGRLA